MLSLDFLVTGRKQYEHLPYPIRKVLHQRGLVTIRQSAYAAGRECGYKLSLYPKNKEQQSSVQALCGSVFHLLVENPDEAIKRSADEGYYQYLFKQIRDRDPDTVYMHKGSVVDWVYVKRLALKFSTLETIGIRLGDLAYRTVEYVNKSGIRIVGQERKLVLKDGDALPVTHTGILDFDATINGQLAHGDLKTTGLWEPYIDDDGGSIKGTSLSDIDVQYHSQLRDYDWLRYRLTGEIVQWHFIVLPANLVPYKDIKRARELRGRPVQMAPTLGLKGILAYEQDRLDFFRSWTAAKPPRAYPTNWGALSCPYCPFWRACQGDVTSSTDAEAFADPRLDYLR